MQKILGGKRTQKLRTRFRVREYGESAKSREHGGHENDSLLAHGEIRIISKEKENPSFDSRPLSMAITESLVTLIGEYEQKYRDKRPDIFSLLKYFL